MQAREALQCSNQRLMGYSSGSSEDQRVYKNVDSKDQTHKTSDGNEGSVEPGLEAMNVSF